MTGQPADLPPIAEVDPNAQLTRPEIQASCCLLAIGLSLGCTWGCCIGLVLTRMIR